MPKHVHVKYGQYESKVELKYKKGILLEIKFLKVHDKSQIPENKLKDAEKFIRKYNRKIIKKWNDYFVFHKAIKSEKVTKKV